MHRAHCLLSSSLPSRISTQLFGQSDRPQERSSVGGGETKFWTGTSDREAETRHPRASIKVLSCIDTSNDHQITHWREGHDTTFSRWYGARSSSAKSQKVRVFIMGLRLFELD